jgi:colanic acid biosynthesis glycosyl transferase WcaI
MKILLVNQTFYPDVVATAHYLTDLAFDLHKQGHDVTVLTSRFSYNDIKTIFHTKETVNGVKVVRAGSLVIFKGTKFARIFNGLSINIAFFCCLLSMPKFDRIVALTSPPLVAFFAAIVAKSKNIKFSYWVMDLNPDQLIAIGWLKARSVRACILELSLRIVLKISDRIIVLDKYMQDKIGRKGDYAKKIHVIPPWSFAEDFNNCDEAAREFKQKNGLMDKYMVMYSGNLSMCHPIKTILLAAKAIANPKVVFCFVGGGSRLEEVLNFKKQHGLKNLIHFPYQDPSDLEGVLASADCNVVTMGDGMVGIVHPCKIYTILEVGKPFIYIGPQISHVQDIIESGGVGYSFRHGEVQAVVERINQEVQHPSSSTQVNQLRLFAKKFSRQATTKYIISLFEAASPPEHKRQ